MKNYERTARQVLPLRLPLILRIDGKAFHTWTRNMERPFDRQLMNWMDLCAIAICEEAQGACVAYVQSDEINVLIHNYRRLETQAWFDNSVQKMASVAASIASATMTLHAGRVAVFDARAFVLPESEVANYFFWRQQDWTRNSLQMLARALYSHKECDSKATSELQEMCYQRGQNWNDLRTELRRGRCVVRQTFDVADTRGPGAVRHKWVIDNEIPIFKLEGRDYVERFFSDYCAECGGSGTRTRAPFTYSLLDPVRGPVEFEVMRTTHTCACGFSWSGAEWEVEETEVQRQYFARRCRELAEDQGA